MDKGQECDSYIDIDYKRNPWYIIVENGVPVQQAAPVVDPPDEQVDMDDEDVEVSDDDVMETPLDTGKKIDVALNMDSESEDESTEMDQLNFTDMNNTNKITITI